MIFRHFYINLPVRSWHARRDQALRKNLILRRFGEEEEIIPLSSLVSPCCARGGIVNEADLYEALKNKTIKAAYFDVFSKEPPTADEPLMTLPNFYLTPHIASRSAEAEKNTADMSTKIVIDALS